MGHVERRGAPALTSTAHRRQSQTVDAVVIGAGVNGLVAANALSDAGWHVRVLGAARAGDSGSLALAAVSPAIAKLGLEQHGLEWKRAPAVLANPLPGGDAVVVHDDVEQTAAALDARAVGDGQTWRRLYTLYEKVHRSLLDALCTPFPPVRPATRMVRTLGAGEALRCARLALLPVRRLGEEELTDPGTRLLFAGCAAGSDRSPEASGGAFVAWMLAMAGQRDGFAAPRGGAKHLTDALARRLEAGGGELSTDREVVHVIVRAGRAIGVVTADGATVRARHAVIADVAAPLLYGSLLDAHRLPPRLPDDLRRCTTGRPAVHIDWETTGPVPWLARGAGDAGTVHLANSVDELTRTAAELAMGELPSRPFVVLRQAGGADSRQATQEARATQVVSAATQVPAHVRADPFGLLKGTWDDDELSTFADRVEARIEQHAPGFRSLVAGRHVRGPVSPGATPAHGSTNARTAAWHQQLLCAPVPGLGRPEALVRGLYLASASAHAGGGLPGACGWNAARAALRANTGLGRVASAGVVVAQWRLAR